MHFHALRNEFGGQSLVARSDGPGRHIGIARVAKCSVYGHCGVHSLSDFSAILVVEVIFILVEEEIEAVVEVAIRGGWNASNDCV